MGKGSPEEELPLKIHNSDYTGQAFNCKSLLSIFLLENTVCDQQEWAQSLKKKKKSNKRRGAGRGVSGGDADHVLSTCLQSRKYWVLSVGNAEVPSLLPGFISLL